jgi:hypothetical protein
MDGFRHSSATDLSVIVESILAAQALTDRRTVAPRTQLDEPCIVLAMNDSKNRSLRSFGSLDHENIWYSLLKDALPIA